MSAKLVERTHILNSKLDTIRFQIILSNFIDNSHMAPGEIKALALFAERGINLETKKFIIESKIFTHYSSIENFIVKMVKLGYLKKEGKGVRTFTNKLDLNTGADSILMNIKIGNK